MRTMVFEPDPSGHHFQYLSLMLPAIHGLAPRPALVTTKGVESSAAYQVCLKPIEHAFELDASLEPERGSPAEVARARADRLLEAARRHRPDHLYAMYLDGLGQILATRRLRPGALWPRGTTSEGLYFRAAIAYPTRGMARRLSTIASWTLATRTPLTFLHHLDPLAFARVRGSPRWSLMPDPVEAPDSLTTAEARRRLGLPEDGRAVGCAGMIDARKGVDLLIGAFAAAGLGATDRLLLIGPHAPEIKDQLRSPSIEPMVRAGRIVSVDRFVKPAELALALVAMDVVCTPYPEHIGSASIVIRAAAAGRPVLGSDFGWVGRTVPQFALGSTCAVRDEAAFARALRGAVEHAGAWTPSAAARRFVAFHSPGNFALHWRVRLREKLGLPPEPGLLAWSWATGESPDPAAGSPHA